jgi:hypothetical protein
MNLFDRTIQEGGNLLRRTVRFSEKGVVDREGGFVHT